MPLLAQFAEEITSKLAKRITDYAFLSIQNDRELMQRYLKFVEAQGLTTVNQQIGRHVKTKFSLTNEDSRQDDPQSFLTPRHTTFE